MNFGSTYTGSMDTNEYVCNYCDYRGSKMQVQNHVKKHIALKLRKIRKVGRRISYDETKKNTKLDKYEDNSPVNEGSDSPPKQAGVDKP